jgi:hypothetical protein
LSKFPEVVAWEAYRYPRKRKRNAKSRKKKSKKNATVDLRVHNKRIVVKMNHPAKK